jgi:hypothetical protein
VNLGVTCRTLHCLPYAGGWLDQPSYTARRLETVFSVLDAVDSIEHRKQMAEAKRGH